MKQLITIFFLINTFVFSAQEYFPTNSGVKSSNKKFTAFTNATIHVNPSHTIKKGTLLIQDQKIVGSGKNINIPKNCIIIDLKGKHLYPSFIDIYTSFGIEKPKKITNPLSVCVIVS